MAALIPKACPGVAGLSPENAANGFLELRQTIAQFMNSRIGSGLEPPEWMQRLAGELDRLQEGKLGGLSDTLMDGPFSRITQKQIDEHLTRINRLNSAQNRDNRN
jgi:hypothetical protein